MKNNILDECMRKAIRLNPYHPEQKSGYHHFSFIVQDHKVLGYGENHGGFIMNPKIQMFASYQKTHSEVAVWFKVKGLLNRMKSFELVNIRLNKDNGIKMSKPCKCCWNFMKSLGCKSFWFTTDIGWGRISL